MLIYNDRSIFRDVPRYFTGSFFIHKAAEASYINVIALRHGIFHHFEKRLHRGLYVSLLNTGFLCNFGNYFCFWSLIAVN